YAAHAMSPAYVRALFDQYAPRFDEALKGLAYGGPARLREADAKARPDITFDHMLDLGCGTGLAGAAFRPPVGHLTRLDPSLAMAPLMCAVRSRRQVWSCSNFRQFPPAPKPAKACRASWHWPFAPIGKACVYRALRHFRPCVAGAVRRLVRDARLDAPCPPACA